MSRHRDVLGMIGHSARRCWATFARLFVGRVDRERFVGASTRLGAVSWPRAAVLAGLVAVILGGGLLWMQGGDARPHPPLLPSDHEVRVGQDAVGSFLEGRPEFAKASSRPTGDNSFEREGD